MIVTFDFDNTLTLTRATWDKEGFLEDEEYIGPNEKMIQYLKNAVSLGHKVLVVSSRRAELLEDTKNKLKEFGILQLLNGVHHTNEEWKADWCLENKVMTNKHFDDDKEELKRFKLVMPETETILVPLHPSWKGVD